MADVAITDALWVIYLPGINGTPFSDVVVEGADKELGIANRKNITSNSIFVLN